MLMALNNSSYCRHHDRNNHHCHHHNSHQICHIFRLRFSSEWAHERVKKNVLQTGIPGMEKWR